MDFRPPLILDKNGHLIGLNPDIARRGHLEARGQVHPELQDFERAALALEVLRRDLGMDQPASRRHPLDAARINRAFVAAGIAVGQFAFENEGHRLETAMGMRPERQPRLGAP
jgi:hypothetical protein